jgi:hypothetical protein
MTIRDFNEGMKQNGISDVGVWYCENCLSFHVKAGEILLTFTRAEFESFSNAVFDTYSSVVTFDEIRGATAPLAGSLISDRLALTH